MAIPIVLGIIAGVCAVSGAANGIHGGVKMKEANDTMKIAKEKHENALKKFELNNDKTIKLMDKIGLRELQILRSFEEFADLIEKIQGRPKFDKSYIEGVRLPKYEHESLKKVSVGANVLLGGISGAAAGTVGGFAAAGVTAAAVMAFGTASTGTAIVTLSGAAAVNATLATLGGGAIGSVAGAGGMALGTTVLGWTTAGVGILVGGIVFNVTGCTLSKKADAAYQQACDTERKVEEICKYLELLSTSARKFEKVLISLEKKYLSMLEDLECVIELEKKTKWSDFTDKEKTLTENLVLIVGILYKMCSTKLVNVSDNEGVNEVNKTEISNNVADANKILSYVNKAVA